MSNAVLINDTTHERNVKEFDEKQMPALLKLLENKGCLYVRVNVGCLSVTSRNGGQINLIGDPSGTGIGFTHKVTADVLKAPAFAPSFGSSIFNYLKVKEHNDKAENKDNMKSYETGLDARSQRVNLIDVFTPELYMKEMEKLHAASNSFFVAAPAVP